ncbi:BTAD domain-containing putative transcriptional regulator [Bacillus sp. AP8]|uniref:BTAD domain-containing putative transcriptional regulator n=2 Tax=Bacillus TaxID=1386 RepID=UPI0002DE0E25|nr:BTAD domain-containing putative transcriptional regulator [Bacillus sp. AP8]
MQSLQIMNTKIQPPGVRDTIIRRATLHRKLQTINQYPVTLLYAGAGYGKSTSLSLYINELKIKASWYSMSSHEDDFLPFLSYIIHSIQKTYPSFGQIMINMLAVSNPYLQEKDVLSISTHFINEIVRLKEEIILIIDDFHHGEKSIEIMEFMETIIEHCPNNFHIVISGRNRPKWKLLTRMKVEGKLLELTQKDLILDKEEVELLMSDVYQLHLTEEEITEIYKITEGWVIALGIIGQQLQIKNDLCDLVQNRTQSLENLFEYIALEVIQKQSSIDQMFLEQTSILEELSGKVCEYILDIDNAEMMLFSLAEKNMFIMSTGDNQYRYHALFKELLEKRFKETQPVAYRKLHEKAAKYYERQAMYDQMLYHLEKSKRFDAIALILQKYGFQLLSEGKLQSLYELVKKIPKQQKKIYYWLWYFEGEILRIRSYYEKAEICYEKAIFESESYMDSRIKSLANEGKARIYIDTIQPGKAERHLQIAIECRDHSEDFTIKEKKELYFLMAENLINSGDVKKAEKWLQRAKSQKLILEDYNVKARLLLRTGRLEEGKRILLERKKVHPFNIENHVPQTHRETDLLLALIEAYMGNGEKSKQYAQQAIQQGILMVSSYVEACGWIRMGHSVQLDSAYESSMAIECYETSLHLMEELKNSRGKAEPYMGLCIYWGAQNNGYEKAIAYGKLALEETEKVYDLWLSSYIKLSLAIASIHKEKWEHASLLLEEAETCLRDCNDSYGLTLVSLWKTYVAFSINNGDVFVKECLTLLQRIQYGNYEFLFLKRTLFGPLDMQQFVPILLEAQRRYIQEHFVATILMELGYGNINLHPGYTLRIETLGAFKVYLGKTEVTDWQRGKAKELFEFFVTHKKDYIQKQQIIDRLWPEQDEKTADRDFKVALNALNSVLEPTRKARMEPFFIKRTGNSYGLNVQSGYFLDTKEFEEWTLAGIDEKDFQRSKDYLERGLRIYKGNYLPDRRFEDWCMNERERLQVIFLRGAERMAQVSIAIKDLNTAIYWCEQIIHQEPTWEEAYRLLMYCYYYKNNRPQSIKWYQKCYLILQQELGVEPLETTKNMYRMILDSARIGPIT